MAVTQAHLDRLEEMMAEGVLDATLPDGSRMRFDTMENLQARIRWVKDRLSRNPRQTNVVHPSFNRGFDSD